MAGHIKECAHGSAAILFVGLGVVVMFSFQSKKYQPLHSYSLFPAITMDGIIYSHIKVGGYNGDQFLEYLEGLLAVMNPYPAPKSVLILDNCSIHHVEGVEEMCTAR
jgi:hypothetical protein